MNASSGTRLAVVIPYIYTTIQFDRLKSMLNRWSMDAYRPCSTALPVALYFYHPTTAPEESVMKLNQLWAQTGSTCFSGGMHILGAALSADIAWRHPDGTCGQFYMLFQLLRTRADYFYLMEPDAPTCKTANSNQPSTLDYAIVSNWPDCPNGWCASLARMSKWPECPN